MKTLKLTPFLIILIFVSVSIIFAQQPSETPPPPANPPTLSVPAVKEMTLPNGLKVVVIARRDIPLVTISLLVKNGANDESDKEAGLANMTAELLTKGTPFRSATEIAQQIEFLGGSINTNAGWNSSTVTVNVMSDKLGKALAIMSDVVIRPTFPAEEVTLLKKQTIDGLNVNLKQPGTLLAYAASRYSFDEHTTIGTPETIKSIKRNDVMQFHNTAYQPQNAVLIFTGDITEDRAFRFAKLFYGGWAKVSTVKESYSRRLNVPTIIGKVDSSTQVMKTKPVIQRMLVIDLPDSGQAAVGFVKKINIGRTNCFGDGDAESIKCRSSSIYYPASVLNSVLGGGYSARLNQEIRLKRGLSYGARSGFDWRGWDTNFNANTQTKNESAAEVAELIKIEIDKLINDSITEEELIPRKAVVTGGFGLGLQTNNGLAARLRDIYLYDLSPEELNSYLTDVNDVTDTQIKNFAAETLSGGDVIIVGDAKMFMEDLKKRFPEQKIEVIKASDLDLNSPDLRKSGRK